ncbi:MAG: N-acetylneuraminate synthase family protein [Bacteriovoracaceae bacterium]
MKIIAEFCQNHNGDVAILDEMLHAAALNGATHCKIQTIFVDDLNNRPEFEEGLVENGVTKVIKRPYGPEYERLKKLELDYKEHENFIAKCKKYGVEPLTTCFSRHRISALKEMGFKSMKVASYDCASMPLIRELSNAFDDLIISTGATFDEEIETTAKYLNQQSKKFSFLHCVTIYPTPLNEIHLNRMKYLKHFTPEVGLSEHTLTERDGIKASVAAIYEGASVIERHFTILGPTESKDGPVSIRPEHLKELSDFAKMSKADQNLYIQEKVPEFETMLGSEKRQLSNMELLNRAYFRGRFVSHINGKVITNWDEVSING